MVVYGGTTFFFLKCKMSELEKGAFKVALLVLFCLIYIVHILDLFETPIIVKTRLIYLLLTTYIYDMNCEIIDVNFNAKSQY